MRQAIISMCVLGLMAIGALGCMHHGGSNGGSEGNMKMSEMACCGDACKKMGDCCKMDASGKAACSMGGNCCMKK